MTTFRQISGQLVKSYTTNPDNPLEGQMWYNQTELKLKGVTALAAWISGSSMTTARNYLAGCGIQTSALAFGGGPGSKTDTEEYNGSGWSIGGALSTARYSLGGAGTQTAGLGFGGYSTTTLNATEEYDGSTWTAGGNLSTARQGPGGAGTQTAGLAFGGNETPPYTAATEEYNGTSWTGGGNMGQSRGVFGSAGLQDAALAFGGQGGGAPPATNFNWNNTEEYDGSAWTAGGNLGAAKYANAGSGIQTAALNYGGSLRPTKTGVTESYDGSAWSTSPASLATARAQLGGAGANSNSALAFGGTPPVTAATEEYNFSAQVITPAAWSSGGNLNTGRTGLGGAGSQTAALAFGGVVATPATPSNPYKNESEEYNGTSWTEGNNLNQARSGISGGGTQTAAIGAGGLPANGVSNTANSEEYDGTSWAEGNNLVNASYNRAGAGTQTATILMGGGNYTNPPPSFSYISNVEYYDGTSWSEQNDMNTARYIAAGCGSQTSSLVSGGLASTGTVANVEEWNGVTWSEVNDLIVANYGHALTGIQTAALQAAGNDGSLTTAAFNYDGTSWTTAPSIGTARQSLAGGGEGSTQTSSIIFGGQITPAPTGYQQTEEFSPGTTAANVVDITTS